MENTQNTENTDSKNIENTDFANQPLLEKVQRQPIVKEKVKKPRKPLTEESKNKRREVLKRAREAKLNKLKTQKETGIVEKLVSKQTVTIKPTLDDIKPLIEPLLKDVKRKKPKTSEDKIMKKVNKKLQIEAIVEEKLREEEARRRDIKEQKNTAKQSYKNYTMLKNLF